MGLNGVAGKVGLSLAGDCWAGDPFRVGQQGWGRGYLVREGGQGESSRVW